ncbi:hypothetical protein Pelo_5502 [Pelomyxa schiedti]|nr:hypothetical protein Pelo_5502 [Pelomyxa schiedti]
MECPVCSELFVDPVTLPCSHSLCMRCVGYCLAVVDGPNLDQAPGGPGPIISAGSALRSSNRSLRMSSGGGGLRASSRAGSTTSTIPRSVLKCPVCKSECNPNSATINKQLCLAVEELRMADLMCEDHPSEPSVRASVICNACIPPIRLCDECNARVHRGPRFKGHLSGSVVLLHPGTPPPARTFCRKHTSELVRFYCPVHDVILCQICVVKFVSDAAQPFSLSASVIARKQEYIASILTVLCEKLLAIDSTRITEIKGTIHSTLTNDVSSITEQHKNLSALVHSLCTQLSELESATETLPDTVLLRKRNELSEVLDVLYNRLHSTGAMEE